jgi:hypothetical protein
MNQSTTKWVLFAAMVCTMPVLYFMFVVAGVLPLVAVIRLSFTGVWGFKLLNSLHLLVYGPMLYLAAKFLTRWLFSLSPQRRALGIALALALALLISLLPIYGIGHSQYTPVNLYQLFQHGRLA